LWMTSAFAGTKTPPGGAAWALANVGALTALALFALAAWGVVRSRLWWQRAASAAAIVGLAALVPYGLAASSTGVSGPGLNSAIHVIGSAAVLLVLLVPAEVIVTHTRRVRVVASRPSGVPCVPVTKPAHWRK
jgi:peptidoglycan/LPS O-acetylase OafA/YrhL